MWLFDAGLHTLHLKQKHKELDVEFVERFLMQYFKGCRNRGENKYKDFVMTHGKGENYMTVWGVK